MKWEVRGADRKSGDDLVKVINARTLADAERIARSEDILVSSCEPIDDVISIPAAPPHPGGGATFVPAAQQNVVVNVLQPMQAAQRWSPGVAAVLSFFIPGLGQMYKGQIVNGLAWLIVVIIGYALFIIPGLILHLLCILGAASGNPTK